MVANFPHIQVLPVPERFDDATHFAQARQISVDVPNNGAGKSDNYINDMIPVCVDINDNAENCSTADALALALLSHHFDPNKPLAHEVLMSMAKLMGEGCFKEIKRVLGWILDTRHLLASLSSNKFTLWSAGLKLRINCGTLLSSGQEALVGNLKHVGYLIPLMHHFMAASTASRMPLSHVTCTR
jgi:hypothetical protein